MKKISDKLYVYVRNIFAGILTRDDAGYEFVYDKNYLKLEDALQVSITLPLSDTIYKSKVLFPFFDGLIPEGWLLDTVIENWKISRNDRFALLSVACKDTIGNVSIREKENELFML